MKNTPLVTIFIFILSFNSNGQRAKHITISDRFEASVYPFPKRAVKYYRFEELLKIEKQDQIFVSEVDMGDEHYLLSRVVNKVNGTNTLYATKIFKDSLSTKPTPIDQNTMQNSFAWNNRAKYECVQSEDKKKILIVLFEPYVFNKIKCIVLDDKLEKIWQNDIQLPETSDEMTQVYYSDFVVTNTGDLYFKGAIRKEKNLLKKGRPDYFISIYFYEYQKKKLTGIKIETEDAFIGDSRLILSKGTVVFAATYSIKKLKPAKDHFFDGAVYATVDLNATKVLSYGTVSLSSQFDKEYLKNLYLSDLYLSADGGVTLVTEQVTTKGPSYFSFDNIFVIKIHEAKNLSWVRRIPKYQFEYGYFGGASFISLFHNETVHIIYNKSKTRIETNDTTGSRPPGVSPYGLKEPKTWQICIDKSGKIIENQEFLKDSQSFFLIPRISSRISEKEIEVGLSERGNSIRITVVR